jgi:hypothetical protein
MHYALLSSFLNFQQFIGQSKKNSYQQFGGISISFHPEMALFPMRGVLLGKQCIAHGA